LLGGRGGVKDGAVVRMLHPYEWHAANDLDRRRRLEPCGEEQREGRGQAFGRVAFSTRIKFRPMIMRISSAWKPCASSAFVSSAMPL